MKFWKLHTVQILKVAKNRRIQLKGLKSMFLWGLHRRLLWNRFVLYWVTISPILYSNGIYRILTVKFNFLAGHYYNQISGELIERIDGLDPAGPLFLDERAFQSADQFIEAKSLVNKTEQDNEVQDGTFKIWLRDIIRRCRKFWKKLRNFCSCLIFTPRN